ncbi:MAG: hypothetical protein K6E97_03895 [Treponema sp.]|nr:hypothetical protein [Treponema sp.]
MKKIISVVLLLVTFTVLLSAQTIRVPKNTESTEEINALRYCDENMEFNYIITSVSSNQLFYFKFVKQLLTTNATTEIICSFNSDEDLSEFLDTFINGELYKDIPQIFIYIKQFCIQLGAEPFYITGEENKIKRILYMIDLQHKSN